MCDFDIYETPGGWGGSFSVGTITVELEPTFLGPETVHESLSLIFELLDAGMDLFD